MLTAKPIAAMTRLIREFTGTCLEEPTPTAPCLHEKPLTDLHQPSMWNFAAGLRETSNAWPAFFDALCLAFPNLPVNGHLQGPLQASDHGCDLCSSSAFCRSTAASTTLPWRASALAKPRCPSA